MFISVSCDKFLFIAAPNWDNICRNREVLKLIENWKMSVFSSSLPLCCCSLQTLLWINYKHKVFQPAELAESAMCPVTHCSALRQKRESIEIYLKLWIHSCNLQLTYSLWINAYHYLKKSSSLSKHFCKLMSVTCSINLQLASVSKVLFCMSYHFWSPCPHL